ncbi:MAG: hypothetical protein NC302_13605 [Bacteroidales bacterium]|nr:hypothetical protein [Bacteroidales bacterium]MCM1416896.1 hypothetical protein [bacterium]MCM1424910.1 hypothetical protein [bacterium]
MKRQTASYNCDYKRIGRGETKVDLAIMKSVFPDFNIESFNMFHEIIFLKWETVFNHESWKEHRNLVMEMISSDHYKILIECKDVDSFCFQGNGQISGFYIKDMSVRGYENDSRYEVGDYEENELKFYCSDIIIRNLEKL